MWLLIICCGCIQSTDTFLFSLVAERSKIIRYRFSNGFFWGSIMRIWKFYIFYASKHFLRLQQSLELRLRIIMLISFSPTSDNRKFTGGFGYFHLIKALAVAVALFLLKLDKSNSAIPKASINLEKLWTWPPYASFSTGRNTLATLIK